ncbi:hypothetical protein ACQP1K_23695 [Sphaerimonospora sp. CA-214678]|uniref:hypothetical protein n=1 Tax=Sphaerimonospora sp. CA-214678 TaxID=3240029 RepID=UPI003D94EEC4
MPTYRDIIAGLTIGAALAGGAVGLGVATSATAANAAVVVQGNFGGDGFIDGVDGTFVDGRFARDRLRREFVRALFADGGNRNNDNSINVFDSFNRQTALQRLRQRNEDRRPR